MPSAERRLDLEAVRAAIGDRCFRPEPVCPVGVELEWLTFASGLRGPNAVAGDTSARIDSTILVDALAAAGPLPGGSSVTFEPGGQFELSSPPFPNIGQACSAAEADGAHARAAAEAAGVRLVGLGADPVREPVRVVASPRYDAMEAYFGHRGPAGARMMCNTAAVQVNLGMGPTAHDVARQWRLAHRLGPTLAAAFANSPLLAGRPSGFRSTRLATWEAVDRTRTAPAADGSAGEAPAAAWARYVLDACVMLIRTDDGFVPLTTSLPFVAWVERGHDLGWPTLDDLDYHLTTLFPPVRPKGWLELRMIDELPDPWWKVPVAVTAALLTDAEAGETADRAVTAAGTADRWVDAARMGLAHPALAASAAACFHAALAALERIGTESALAATVAAYADLWVSRGRSPADDRLDAWSRDGEMFPEPEEALSWT